MTRINPITHLTLALAASAALTIGCGTENSLVASHNAPTITSTENGLTFLTFSPQATQRAGKIAAGGTDFTHLDAPA